MKTNNNIPSYRFQGYTDAWELRKLGEVVSELKSGLSRELSSTDIGLPVVRANNISDNQLNLEKDIKYWYQNDPQGSDTSVYFIEQNDILVNFINSEAKMGTAAIVKNSPSRPTIYTTNILRMRCTNDLIPYFFLYYTNLDCYKNFIKGITKIAVNQASFTTVDYKKYELFVPEVDEQSTIGTFFSTLDQHITLHQRKLDTLKEQKKTYLKLLFPAKGQTKPALRFRGFEDDWEEVKLGEVLVEYNKKSEIENQFELLSSTNSGIEPRSGRVSGESNIGYKIIKRGMVVLSPQNLWLGNINYNAKFEIGIVSPSYKVFNIYGPNELFLATVLRLPQMFFEYAQASVQGASIVRRNLDLDLFGSILVPLPTLPEQEVIGSFFQTLDQEIAQVEDKLASLKEMKKTLLRKLFA
ncbi:TPA: restriction endonuclease subunit S [Streptococcus suis]|uniref:restriction endonuclease subunit S n=1 Tax=Streptococcus suis TaxID=1307 RepID=UPI0004180133|nr:restriction endonuclease subunit S [Streptococcus suis]HEM3173718.1 restriction endonuclease subunit S [Streptococcus suis]